MHFQVVSAQPQLATQAPRASPGARPYVNRGMAAAALAASRIRACYEADQLDAAERLAAQFEEDITLAAVPEFIAPSMVSIARVHAARGRMIQACDTLERLSFQSQWAGVREMIAGERRYLAGRSGEPGHVEALLPQMSSDAPAVDPAWIPVTEMLSGPLLGRIRLAMHQHRLERAADLTKAALSIAPARPLLTLKLQVLNALVHYRQGYTRLALRLLKGASDVARAGGAGVPCWTKAQNWSRCSSRRLVRK